MTSNTTAETAACCLRAETSKNKDPEQFAETFRSLFKPQNPSHKTHSESQATAAMIKFSEYPPVLLFVPAVEYLSTEDQFRDLFPV